MINIRIKFFTCVPHAPSFLLLPVSLQTINPRGFGFQIELNKCINLLWQEFHHMSNCICWISRIYSKKSADAISNFVLTRIPALSKCHAVPHSLNKISETWHTISAFYHLNILEQHLAWKISLINSAFAPSTVILGLIKKGKNEFFGNKIMRNIFFFFPPWSSLESIIRRWRLFYIFIFILCKPKVNKLLFGNEQHE